LTKRGREHSGLCPFHNEKTPSFTVSDDKGFYHCFGCGAHGDVIKFVQETEGLSFPEAIERLAAEAGMQVPRQSPQERERAERAASLYDVVEAAAAWFQEQLQGESGQGARRYLQGRGLDAPVWQRFRIGYAPDRRGLFRKAMNAKSIDDDKLIAAGLLKKAEDGSLRDYFFDRVMIPITDRRGRVIAFGGRALGDSPAKYLNSPDNELFHKGRILYNLAGARKALSGQSGAAAARLTVVEGYMDVIALAEHGFPAAVAPLGTAITEDQLRELWRLAEQPLLCLDGDSAGLRAAARAAERALPLLKPGASLKFAFLPSGEDPDSLLRTQGASTLTAVLEKAISLDELLWRQTLEAHSLATPEERAALKEALRRLVSAIGDKDVREAYALEFRRRLDELFNPRSSAARREQALPRRGGGGRPGGASEPRRVASFLRQPPELLGRRREELLLVTLINHPELIEDRAERLAQTPIGSSDLARLRGALLEAHAGTPGLDREALRCHLCEAGFSGLLDRLQGRNVYVHGRFARPEASSEEAGSGWQDVLAQIQREQLQSEREEAERRWAEEPTEENLAQLSASRFGEVS
jgi:DNA primase